MQFFIGIVPPEEYKQKVIEFQHKWINNTITDVVEPHITLKAQGGLTEDKKWLNNVKNICCTTEPFQISLGEPMFFGEDILYISARSHELHGLHRRIVGEIAPSRHLIKKYFELEDFVPHMTLGKTTYGLTKQELIEMSKLAEEELSPFPAFDVNFIRVYQEIEQNKYRKLEDIPLGR